MPRKAFYLIWLAILQPTNHVNLTGPRHTKPQQRPEKAAKCLQSPSARFHGGPECWQKKVSFSK